MVQEERRTVDAQTKSTEKADRITAPPGRETHAGSIMDDLVQITVPRGFALGGTIFVDLPSGVQVHLVLPAGSATGSVIFLTTGGKLVARDEIEEFVDATEKEEKQEEQEQEQEEQKEKEQEEQEQEPNAGESVMLPKPNSTTHEKSRYLGVSRSHGKWKAHFHFGKPYLEPGGCRKKQRRKATGSLPFLGSFDEEETAARAYDAAAREQRGDQAHGGGHNLVYRLNFPTAEEAAGLVRLAVADVVERLLRGVAASDRRAARVSRVQPKSTTFVRRKSAYVGVSQQDWGEGRGKWNAGISNGGKMRSMGAFDDEEAAARAYDAAARELRGEQAHGGGCGLIYRLNFPTAEEAAGLVRLAVADVMERLLVGVGAAKQRQIWRADSVGAANRLAEAARGQALHADTGPRRQTRRPRRGTAGPKACATLAGKVGQPGYAHYEWGGHILVAVKASGRQDLKSVIGSTVFKAATDAIFGQNENDGWFEQHANGFTSQVRRNFC